MKPVLQISDVRNSLPFQFSLSYVSGVKWRLMVIQGLVGLFTGFSCSQVVSSLLNQQRSIVVTPKDKNTEMLRNVKKNIELFIYFDDALTAINACKIIKNNQQRHVMVAG